MTAPIMSATIFKDGKLTIPKKLRKALSLSDGQSVILRQTDQGILIESTSELSRGARAQALVRQAKLNVTREVGALDAQTAWAQYDAAAAALRKALRTHRPPKTKR